MSPTGELLITAHLPPSSIRKSGVNLKDLWVGQHCLRGLGGAAAAWGARALARSDGNVNMVARVHPEPVEGVWLENQWDLLSGRFQHFMTRRFIMNTAGFGKCQR